MKVLVVEDDALIAIDIESMIEACGHVCVGTASDTKEAVSLADGANLAFVDLNLRDGPTGMEIGHRLADDFGLTVIYMTGDPENLGPGVDGTLGVLPKPVSDREVRQLIDYVAKLKAHAHHPKPPVRFTAFHDAA